MKKEYIYNNNGIIEKVEEERWGWAVIYKDDTELKQFDDTGIFHRIGEVNQEEVKMYTLYKLEDQSKRIDILVNASMRLIHLYRNIKPFYMDQFVKVYVFGYKQGKQYHYNFILPDDRIIQSSIDNINLETFDLSR